MKRFTFQLENVLKYRETLENLAKNNYREALRLLNIEKDKLLTLQKRRDALKSAYKPEIGSIIDPDTLTFISNYTGQLLFLMDKQKKAIVDKEKIAKSKFEVESKTKGCEGHQTPGRKEVERIFTGSG